MGKILYSKNWSQFTINIVVLMWPHLWWTVYSPSCCDPVSLMMDGLLSIAQKLRTHWSSGTKPKPSQVRSGSLLNAKLSPLPIHFPITRSIWSRLLSQLSPLPHPRLQVSGRGVWVKYERMLALRQSLSRRVQAPFLNSEKKTVVSNNETLWEQNR